MTTTLNSSAVTCAVVKALNCQQVNIRVAYLNYKKYHEQIIQEMNTEAEAADQTGDISTADGYTRFVQTHQKHRWFLEEILRKQDGLVS